MIIETKKIKDLKHAPYNPRKSNERQEQHLKASLEKFGVVEPVVFNKQTGFIVGGHFRVRELKKLGYKEIDCVIVDLNEEDEKELNIRLNANTGEWNIEDLQTNWNIAELNEWGLEIPDFNSLEAEEDDFEVPEGGIETDIVLGDLFEIGEHRLLCGDSTDLDSVARLMNGEKADMVFTDPPYNVDYEGKTKEKLKIQNDKHTISEFRNFINASISNLILFTKKGGSYYVCIPLEVGVTDLFLEKTHLQSVIMWLKNTIVMGRKDYQQKTEPILFMINEEQTIEDSYEGIVYGWIFGDSHEYYGGRKQSNVWEFDKPQRNGKHPTMKPILLIAKAINNSSKIGMLVLDLFLGSGSTMVASHQLKRKCYGMELDPKYCQVIIDRMKKLDDTLIIKRNGIQI